ncbi:MAG: ABC transporter permease, partial [Plesiomonas shigelloides]
MTDRASPSESEDFLHKSDEFRIRFQSLRVIFALLMREMTTSFGRSKLGYLWAVLEPVGGIAVLTLGFSILFRQPPLGDSFALFYATGFIPFACYTNTYAQVSSALKANRSLLFYPAVTFIDVIIARVLLVVLTQFAIWTIVISGILLFENTGAHLDISRIALSFISAIAVGTAIGLVNATLFELIPSWQQIWGILNRPIFFLSCIFFVFESMPPGIQTFLWWNPLVHVIGTMRDGVYSEYAGDYISLLYVIAFALVLAVIGLLNMR